MNRILDLTPSPEEAVIPRILLVVHQAIDEHFPSAETAGRQFSKTIFSDDAVEKTATERRSLGDESSIGIHNSSHLAARDADLPPLSQELLNSQGYQAPQATPANSKTLKTDTLPPPPQQRRPKSIDLHEESQRSGNSASPPQDKKGADPLLDAKAPIPEKKQIFGNGTQLNDEQNLEPAIDKADWVTRVTLALLVAGIMLLAYVVLT